MTRVKIKNGEKWMKNGVSHLFSNSIKIWLAPPIGRSSNLFYMKEEPTGEMPTTLHEERGVSKTIPSTPP